MPPHAARTVAVSALAAALLLACHVVLAAAGWQDCEANTFVQAATLLKSGR